MFSGLDAEALNTCEVFGFAGGVSQMITPHMQPNLTGA